MPCPSHEILERIIGIIGPDKFPLVPFQTRGASGRYSKEWTWHGESCPIETNSGDARRMCDEAQSVFASGDSRHIAPYRKVKPGFRMLVWLDFDEGYPSALRLPFWPSRRDWSRGHAVFFVDLEPGWSPQAVLSAYTSYYKADKAASPVTHSFRMPGFSSVKEGADVPPGRYIDWAGLFLRNWYRRAWIAPRDVSIATDVPLIPARPKPKPRRAADTHGVITQAVIEAVRAAWRLGQRHEAALALAGILRKGGLTFEEARNIIVGMAAEMQDPEVADRVKAVRTTYLQPLGRVAGYKALEKLRGGNS